MPIFSARKGMKFGLGGQIARSRSPANPLRPTVILFGKVPPGVSGLWVRFDARDHAAHAAALAASIGFQGTTNDAVWGGHPAGELALAVVEQGDFPTVRWYLVPAAELPPADRNLLRPGDWSQILAHAALVNPPQAPRPHTPATSDERTSARRRDADSQFLG
jgi:hypothetical protein